MLQQSYRHVSRIFALCKMQMAGASREAEHVAAMLRLPSSGTHEPPVECSPRRARDSSALQLQTTERRLECRREADTECLLEMDRRDRGMYYPRQTCTSKNVDHQFQFLPKIRFDFENLAIQTATIQLFTFRRMQADASLCKRKYKMNQYVWIVEVSFVFIGRSFAN